MDVQSDRDDGGPMVSLRPAISPSRFRRPARALSRPCRQKNIAIRIFYYGYRQALFRVGLTVRSHPVTAFIGPSGVENPRLFRCLNRMNDLVEGRL